MSLLPVDDDWLAQARAAMPALAALPSPRTLLLLGGPTAAVRFDLVAFAAHTAGDGRAGAPLLGGHAGAALVR